MRISKTLAGAGALEITIGVLAITGGITVGVLLLANGGKLLKAKKNL